MPRRQPPGTIATNRRARHDYEILEHLEAGIVLRGSEVKTLREGKASLQDAYAVIQDGEVILHMQIPAYSHTGYEGHEPTRPPRLRQAPGDRQAGCRPGDGPRPQGTQPGRLSVRYTGPVDN